MERLEDAQMLDGRYHAAKLQAYAFVKPELIYDEHRDWRDSLTTEAAPAPRLSPELMEQAAALWKRCREAEARHAEKVQH